MWSNIGHKFNLFAISVLYFATSAACQDVNMTIPLNATLTYDNKEIYGAFITLNGESHVQVNFSDIDKSLNFIVFQVHSHLLNISLNATVKEENKGMFGTNLGLVSFIDSLSTFHIVNANKNVTARVFISVHGYEKDDPIPGGCNMEFPIPISPYIIANTYPDYIFVDAAPPSTDKTCDVPLINSMAFYMMYLPDLNFYADVYFDGIRKMMTLKNIQKYGKLLPMSSWPETRRMLSAYPGTGAVYAVVATRVMQNETRYSVYVPSYSYGCTDVVEDGCEMIDDWLSQIMCAALLFVGLFVCFFGHRFFKTEMFLAGFFSGVIITYILIALMAHIDKPALLGAAALSGVFFGAIWWLFWWLYGIPVLAVLLPSLNLGFMLAAIFYYRLPGHQIYLEMDFNFWSIFVLVVMLTALAVVSVSYAANILCCAVLGAYAAVLSIDYYLGSHMKFILINVFRRAVVPHFNKAILAAPSPFEWRDFTVTLIWVILATLGFIFQHWYNRGRPPFPPPPRIVRPSMAEPTMYGAVEYFMRRERAPPPLPTVRRVQDERTALLA
uniref:TM7S3/TM198-like domain-containing protein n=1 Tax=Heliothis virescens TaxID=7102 RepID=A0A2A4J1W6_HELVI